MATCTQGRASQKSSRQQKTQQQQQQHTKTRGTVGLQDLAVRKGGQGNRTNAVCIQQWQQATNPHVLLLLAVRHTRGMRLSLSLFSRTQRYTQAHHTNLMYMCIYICRRVCSELTWSWCVGGGGEKQGQRERGDGRMSVRRAAKRQCRWFTNPWFEADEETEMQDVSGILRAEFPHLVQVCCCGVWKSVFSVCVCMFVLVCAVVSFYPARMLLLCFVFVVLNTMMRLCVS